MGSDRVKKLLRTFVIIVVVGFIFTAGYILYLGPRLAGDNYVRALQTGDNIALRDSVCPDDLLSNILGSGSGVLASLGVTPGGEIRNANYNLIGRAYTFDWVFGSALGVDVSTPIRIHIDAVSPFRFCVREIAPNN